MRHSGILLAAILTGMATAVAAAHEGRPEVPADYPSHRAADPCGGTRHLAELRQRLTQYNLTRVGIGAVLRGMADRYELRDDVRAGLVSFAENFEQMQRDLPDPDPDSDEFRNFDFKLGLAFSALALFLNTRDETLAHDFAIDRDDPKSDLNLYLTALDTSRDGYLSSLDAAGAKPPCGSAD